MNVSKLGMGVMLGMLGGNKESAEAFQTCVGKEIKATECTEKSLNLTFSDGVKLSLFDDRQSAYEHRYMRTDDKITDFIGATLQSAEVKEAPPVHSEYGDHEVAFLQVTTSKGSFTVETHNEHNGYYGGFLVRASLTPQPSKD